MSTENSGLEAETPVCCGRTRAREKNARTVRKSLKGKIRVVAAAVLVREHAHAELPLGV